MSIFEWLQGCHICRPFACQDSWRDGLLKDVDSYFRIMNAYQANKEAFQEAEAAHSAKIDDNAQQAAEYYLFGRDKETKIDRGGLLEMHHIRDADFVNEFVPGLKRFAAQCCVTPRARERAITEADVGVVFFVDFASVGSMNDAQLRNILTAHRNAQCLPYDSVLLGFYPEKPKGYSQFKKTGQELSAQQEAQGQAPEAEPESDDDLLVDEDAALPDTSSSAKVKKSHRELRAGLSKDKASIDEMLCRGDLEKWFHESISLPLAHSNASLRDARDGFVLLPVQASNKDLF